MKLFFCVSTLFFLSFESISNARLFPKGLSMDRDVLFLQQEFHNQAVMRLHDQAELRRHAKQLLAQAKAHFVDAQKAVGGVEGFRLSIKLSADALAVQIGETPALSVKRQAAALLCQADSYFALSIRTADEEENLTRAIEYAEKALAVQDGETLALSVENQAGALFTQADSYFSLALLGVDKEKNFERAMEYAEKALAVQDGEIPVLVVERRAKALFVLSNGYHQLAVRTINAVTEYERVVEFAEKALAVRRGETPVLSVGNQALALYLQADSHFYLARLGVDKEKNLKRAIECAGKVLAVRHGEIPALPVQYHEGALFIQTQSQRKLSSLPPS